MGWFCCSACYSTSVSAVSLCYPSPVANPEHLALFKGRAPDWNRWRQENPEIKPDLSGADLQNEYMPEVNLNDADLQHADLRRANLRGASLVKSKLQEADLYGADLRQADLTNADLTKARLVSTNLYQSILQSAHMRGADLSAANLRKAKLSHAFLAHATLRRTDLREAVMANAFLESADMGEATLSEANLRAADLTGANLSNTSLFHASLRRACLQRADLSGADLSQADLNRADLQFTNLTGAELIQTDLTRANLSQSNLHCANFNRATLTDCKLWETLRAGWGVRGVLCERAFWDSEGEKATEYTPGEFERIYSEQTCIELFYEGGMSSFELGTLPALLQHLTSMHPGTNILLKTIEQAGGGAKITLSLGYSDEQTKKNVEADAVEVVQAQLRLRSDETLRLQIENATLKQMHETTIRLILTGSAPHITFNAPVHTAALASGSASVEIRQTFNDNTELIELFDKLFARNTELTAPQAAEIEAAKAELEKPNPDKSLLTRTFRFLKTLPKEAVLKGAGKLGERAAEVDYTTLLHHLGNYIHSLPWP
jgi:uncharacterized protein YjbI with pentapeptide repeats